MLQDTFRGQTQEIGILGEEGPGLGHELPGTGGLPGPEQVEDGQAVPEAAPASGDARQGLEGFRPRLGQVTRAHGPFHERVQEGAIRG